MKDGAEKRERICREGKQGVKPEGREGRGAGEGRRRREGGGRGTGGEKTWSRRQRNGRRSKEDRERERRSERQPGSSAALNSFDPVRLARRSSRYIPVAGWAQSVYKSGGAGGVRRGEGRGGERS